MKHIFSSCNTGGHFIKLVYDQMHTKYLNTSQCIKLDWSGACFSHLWDPINNQNLMNVSSTNEANYNHIGIFHLPLKPNSVFIYSVQSFATKFKPTANHMIWFWVGIHSVKTQPKNKQPDCILLNNFVKIQLLSYYMNSLIIINLFRHY